MNTQPETKHAPALGEPLSLVSLGELRISNPRPGEPNFMSAASGVVLQGPQIYAIGDDMGDIGHWRYPRNTALEALRLGTSVNALTPGHARRIIPGILPIDSKARVGVKPDFEALTYVGPGHFNLLDDLEVAGQCHELFPHGLLLMVGSGGLTWTPPKIRRSIGVVYSLDEHGNVTGLPTKVSFEGLHEYLAGKVPSGKLNIEGITVYNNQLVLAQRGNSLDQQGYPAPNQLIYLSLARVLESLYTDLEVGEPEVDAEIVNYNLGHLPLEVNGQTYEVKLDLTDIDTVVGDEQGRMVFTAAAEGVDDMPDIANKIAGAAIGVLDASGNITAMWPLADRSIKPEGINAHFEPATGTIDMLVVSDADNPEVAAPLMAARIPA